MYSNVTWDTMKYIAWNLTEVTDVWLLFWL